MRYVERFGDPADPPVLLIGNSMLTWPDEFCERLAAGLDRSTAGPGLSRQGRHPDTDLDPSDRAWA
ncbi:hypothetical protein [Fodinicola feengrottensis]|uniref:hypothetical protein n=1 Tax=Fodinicola feengrottensis TaxID=435914 RepID=UPI0031D7E142